VHEFTVRSLLSRLFFNNTERVEPVMFLSDGPVTCRLFYFRVVFLNLAKTRLIYSLCVITIYCKCVSTNKYCLLSIVYKKKNQQQQKTNNLSRKKPG
jgi:hypothetical protein